MADPTDPRLTAPDCPHPGCGAKAGDLFCYTATGFPRHMHATRLKTPKPKPEPGSLTRRRPTEKQHRIMRAAMAEGGFFEMSGYRFHGDAQRRAAMTPMADPARGWFRKIRYTDHGTMYELTDAGRLAYYRYEDWINGGTGR